jgi:hypothetical protein
MDPYLEEERLWPWFQHQLAITLQRTISARIGDRYCARLSERCFHSEVHDHCEDFIGIYAAADGRLVTLLEIASPADKLTEVGRTVCKEARWAAQNSRASVVEIDLVLQGQPLMEYSREGLPHWDYAVTVTRATNPDRYEIYVSTLEKRLPRFCLPLVSNDRDLVVDLQRAFSQTYGDCDFGSQIDYLKDPAVPLSADLLGRVAAIPRAKS